MDEIEANGLGEFMHAYQFPGRQAPYHTDGVASSGQAYTADKIGSCAKYPEMIGVPVPHPGRMKDYMPALIEWSKADAPIRGHEHLVAKGSKP